MGEDSTEPEPSLKPDIDRNGPTPDPGVEPENLSSGSGLSQPGASDAEQGNRPAANSDPFGVHVINQFYGATYNKASTYGASRSGSQNTRTRKRATGRLSEESIDRDLRSYVRPSEFPAALAALKAHSIVVLVGRGDVGKRAGALALHRAASASDKQVSITLLSPTLSMADLARYPFSAGSSYVLVDKIEERSSGSVYDFNARNLLERLDKASARLVITSRPAEELNADSFRGVAVQWHLPSCESILKAVKVGSKAGAVDGDLIDDFVRTLTTASEVRAAIDQLPNGLASAIEASKHGRRVLVDAWFDTMPEADMLAAVALAALAPGLQLPLFDELHSSLAEALGDSAKAGARTKKTSKGVAQSRRKIFGPDSLAEIVADESSDSYERAQTVQLRPTVDGDYVLAQLYARYGRSLWSPVNRWIETASRSEDSYLQSRIAVGLSSLLKCDAGGARTQFIDRWAKSSSQEQQLMAAMVLWTLSDDESFSADALQIAVQWIESGNSRMRTTALFALGAELGILFPEDALRWLWHFSVDEESGSHAGPAAGSLVNLIAIAARSSRGTYAILNLACRSLSTSSQIGADKASPIDVHRSLWRQSNVASTIVCAAMISPVEPLPAACVIADRRTSKPLGRLWSEALQSRRHRAQALRALVRTLSSLAAGSEARERISALGVEVVRALPDVERPLLRRDLISEIKRVDVVPRRLAETVLAALLNVLEPEVD